MSKLLFISTLLYSFSARKSVISTPNREVTNAGEEVFLQGGNAADIAAAVIFALGVVEGSGSGIGGGLFAVYYDAKTDTVYTIDGREEAPRNSNPKMFCSNPDCIRDANCSCNGVLDYYDALKGGVSVGVPGTVDATNQLVERFGKLTLRDAVQPAANLARNGFNITHYEYYRLTASPASDALRENPEAANFWYNSDGSLKYDLYDAVSNPDMADTLEQIGDNWKDFYEGEIARDIINAVKNNPNPLTGNGGLMEMSDLSNYKSVMREPVHFDIGKYKVYGMDLPSSGPTVINMVTETLHAYFEDSIPTDVFENDEFVHAFIQAQNLAFADRKRYMGDPDFSDVPSAQLRSKDFARTRASQISNDASETPVPPGDPYNLHRLNFRLYETPEHGTHHFSVIDDEGNIASVTTTVEYVWGSGIMVPGRGFILNNELTDFFREAYVNGVNGTLLPNAPEGGWRPRGDTGTQGGKRPLSSMSPLIVFENGQPIAALGSSGGSTIIASTMNTLYHFVLEGKSAQESVDAPRIWARNGDFVDIEQEIYDRVASDFRQNRNYGKNTQDIQLQPYAPGNDNTTRICYMATRSLDGTFSYGVDRRRKPESYGAIISADDDFLTEGQKEVLLAVLITVSALAALLGIYYCWTKRDKYSINDNTAHHVRLDDLAESRQVDLPEDNLR